MVSLTIRSAAFWFKSIALGFFGFAGMSDSTVINLNHRGVAQNVMVILALKYGTFYFTHKNYLPFNLVFSNYYLRFYLEYVLCFFDGLPDHSKIENL